VLVEDVAAGERAPGAEQAAQGLHEPSDLGFGEPAGHGPIVRWRTLQAMTADVVLVGGGHHALIAAAQLARAGRGVVVLEAAERPGGALQSGEVAAPGHVSDLFATNLNLLLGSPAYAALADDLARHGLELATSAQPFASAFPDGTALRVHQDAPRTLEGLRAHHSGDAEGWARLDALYERLSPMLFSLYAAPVPSLEVTRTLLGALRSSSGRHGVGELARLLLSSTRELADGHLRSPEAKALLAAWGLHLDFAPDVSGGAMFALLESFTDMRVGMTVVRGGASRLVDALVAVVREHGGEVRTGARVERIEVRGGRAAGIELAGGERVGARAAVVAGVAPSALAALLDGTRLPMPYGAGLRGYRPGPGTMMVHLALRGPIPWAAGADLAEFAYVHVGSYLEHMAGAYAAAMEGLLPTDPLLVVGQTSAVDPSRVPEGRHLAWIQVRPLPNEVRGDAAGEIAAAGWEDAAEPFAERVLAILERHAPGVRELVDGRAVLSPADLERHDANLVGGDSLCGSMHLGQNFLLRPVPGWSRYRTPVRGLLHIGAATWPGPGVHGLSGHHAAQALLRRGAVSRRLRR
jgi:phytoene dehydrogenase-like protein